MEVHLFPSGDSWTRARRLSHRRTRRVSHVDHKLLLILGLGLVMSSLALVGGVFGLLQERTLARWIKPMIAFAAGSLMGGAFFHMLPHALGAAPAGRVFLWVVVGFGAFFLLDQVLDWHQQRRGRDRTVQPVGPLLLIADGVHNLIGGLSIGAIFMVDTDAGVAAWLAAAVHELPQELGDFGVLVHAGFGRRRALLLNLLSALTFPLGGLCAWILGGQISLPMLIALGGGNFVYIAAANLIPEVKRAERLSELVTRLLCFWLGVGLLYAGAVWQHR